MLIPLIAGLFLKARWVPFVLILLVVALTMARTPELLRPEIASRVTSAEWGRILGTPIMMTLFGYGIGRLIRFGADTFRARRRSSQLVD